MAKKAAKRIRRCKCVEQVNEKLAQYGAVIETRFVMDYERGAMRQSGPIIKTERIDGKRSKIPTVMASHCPFCGRACL